MAELFKWQPYSMKASAFPWYRADCDQINSADMTDTHMFSAAVDNELAL